MKINLLTPQVTIGVYCCDLRVQALICLMVALGVIFFWHLALCQKIAVATKSSHYLQQQLQELGVKNREHDKTKNQTQIAKEKEFASFVAALESKRTNLVRVFTALHQGVTSSLYLTQLLLKGGEVKLFGQVGLLADLAPLITSFTTIKDGSGASSIQKITKQDGGYYFALSFH